MKILFFKQNLNYEGSTKTESPVALVSVVGWGEKSRLCRCRMLTDFRALGTSCPRAEQNRVQPRALPKWKSQESKCCRASGAPPLAGVALRQGLHHTGEAGESLSECGQQARAAGSCCRKVDIVHLPFRSTSWPPGECAFSQLMDTLSPGRLLLGLLLL